MANISKLLVASGLVILTGPLCLIAQAQDYVDVEAERQGRSPSSNSNTSAPTTSGLSTDSYGQPSSADPYGVQPAQSYPATSYGVNRAPIGAQVGSPSAIENSAIGAPVNTNSGGGNQNLSNLFLQLQQLQQEVMRLNGRVEEQANELRTLKAQSLERYVDLDKRLNGGASSVVAGSSAVNAQMVAPVETPRMSGGSGASELPGEADAYQAAYSLVRKQQFDQAVDAFKQFLRKYPNGKYAANAHYWLGELYLVIDPPELESSRQSFTLLLSQYPDNSKAPDAMYKLGKVQFLKGNRDKAREYLDRVIREYGNTNSSAVKLSQDFIKENY